MSKEVEKHYHLITIVFIFFLVCIVLYLHFRVNDLEVASTQPALSQPVEVVYPGAHWDCLTYENRTSFKVTQPFFTSDCDSIIFDYCNKVVSEELNCNISGCLYTDFENQDNKCLHTFRQIIGYGASNVDWTRIPPELGIKLIQGLGCITNLTIENVTEQVCTKEVLVRDVANSASEDWKILWRRIVG